MKSSDSQPVREGGLGAPLSRAGVMRGRERGWGRGFFFIAIGIFLVHVLIYRGYLLDDAYISLRYALNLTEGHGLVFNPGERVEGYTNFLWVILGALFLVLGLDAMVMWKIVSAIAALATLVGVHRLGATLAPWGPSPAIWLLSAAAFGYYATTGMETMFFAGLATLAVLLALEESRHGRRRGSVVLFVLLAMTRPEGVFVFGVCTAVMAWGELHRRGAWGLRRRIVDGLIFSVLFGSYFLWRWSYYGELLPNTFHAKVTGGEEQWWGGFIHFGEWAATHPLFALALVLPAVLLLRSSWRQRVTPEVMALWLLSLAWTAYVIAVGGDSFPYYRFFIPAMPWLAILTSALVTTLWPRPRQALIAILLFLQVAAGLFSEQPMRAFVADRTTAVGLVVGRHVAGESSADDLLAVNTAGALPYASGLPTLDMLGLTEPAIARREIYVVSPRWAGHRRGWGDYVLARRPDLVFWYNSAGAREPHYLGDHQLADNPFFRFFYQLKQVRLPPLTEAGYPTAKFLGAPFGEGTAPDLGSHFEVRRSLWTRTVASDAAIMASFFELRNFADDLWPILDPPPSVEDFLDGAIDHWRRRLPADFDPEARSRVEDLCRQAAANAEAGHFDTAKELLSRAATLNSRAGSPLVGQYVANLAVIEKNLFLAVQAQIEALRLDPDNPLYRANLLRLLTVPYKEFTADQST